MILLFMLLLHERCGFLVVVDCCSLSIIFVVIPCSSSAGFGPKKAVNVIWVLVVAAILWIVLLQQWQRLPAGLKVGIGGGQSAGIFWGILNCKHACCCVLECPSIDEGTLPAMMQEWVIQLKLKNRKLEKATE